MGWDVIISPSAELDLQETVQYIAKDNPNAAFRLGQDLIEKAESIGNFPESGRIVPEFKLADLREIIHKNFRIIFRVRRNPNHNEVVRFWHGARGFPRLS